MKSLALCVALLVSWSHPEPQKINVYCIWHNSVLTYVGANPFCIINAPTNQPQTLWATAIGTNGGEGDRVTYNFTARMRTFEYQQSTNGLVSWQALYTNSLPVGEAGSNAFYRVLMKP